MQWTISTGTRAHYWCRRGGSAHFHQPVFFFFFPSYGQPLLGDSTGEQACVNTCIFCFFLYFYELRASQRIAWHCNSFSSSVHSVRTSIMRKKFQRWRRWRRISSDCSFVQLWGFAHCKVWSFWLKFVFKQKLHQNDKQAKTNFAFRLKQKKIEKIVKSRQTLDCSQLWRYLSSA